MRLLASLALVAAAATGDAKKEAWFAFRAGEQGDKEAIPRLVASLKNEPDARPWILDALIRLEAEVPAEGVAEFSKQFREQTLVLLARDPKENEEHLASIAEGANQGTLYLHWVTACNLLAAQKSKRLAAPLLRDLELNVEILVRDPDQSEGRPRVSCTSTFNRLFGAADRQWPPAPWYEFTDQQGGGAVPFACGRKTVFFVRRIAEPEADGSTVRDEPQALVEALRSLQTPYVEMDRRHGDRVAYLEDLLGIEPGKLGLEAEALDEITWRGVENYRSDTAAVRGRIDKTYGDVLTSLAVRRLLDSQDVPAAPRVTIEVIDRRKDKSVALPALEGVTAKPD